MQLKRSGQAAGRIALLTLIGGSLFSGFVQAHHSFAMYDRAEAYVMTGVVTRINPDSNHLQIFFGVLDDARRSVIRDEAGEPIIWAVELRSSSQMAQDGITVETFPPGTIFSIGLHPLRNGLPGGGRGEFGLYKCPPNTPPAAGMHCDSVTGSTKHGAGELPEPTGRWPQ